MLPEYQKMKAVFAAEGLELTGEQYRKFDLYAELLLRWNEKINLTSITAPEEMVVKHFLDSVLPLRLVNVPHETSLIDVGTGAGFPGLAMKLYRPDFRVTLLDSLNKRVRFLSEVCGALNADADCVHGRAEELGHKPEYREMFDFAVARAVAAMPVLAEYCLPFVKVGGCFLAMKGPGENYRDGAAAVKTLGGEVADVKDYTLPNGDKRVLIVVEKVFPTGEKYPRNGGQIAKKPL